jgi:peptidoglycan/LPS O-acetylase OafA/YrhL
MALDSRQLEQRDRVPALDLLRLVAVLGVVLFHYGFRGPAEFGTSDVAVAGLSSFARYGYLGVPIFFIISGFVIAYSAEGRTATEFAIARIARIYPGFVFCMTLTFVVTLAFGAPHFTTNAAQWAANLIVAAPALHQPYMDSAYWSLVVEVTFYAWVTVLIAAGLFPRRIDAIVLVWLWISIVNEMTIDAAWIEKIFLADYSGFLATGLLIYELYRGRRDAVLMCLLASSIGAAVFQAIHNLAWLRDHTGTAFDNRVVAAICLASIAAILLATRIRRLFLPAGAVIALGGMTYPLYLLHQQLGYVVFLRTGPTANPVLLVGSIVVGVGLLSWVVWRHVERPSRRWARQTLTGLAAKFGRSPKPQAAPTAI